MEEVETGAEAMTRPSRAHAESCGCVQVSRGRSFPPGTRVHADPNQFRGQPRRWQQRTDRAAEALEHGKPFRTQDPHAREPVRQDGEDPLSYIPKWLKYATLLMLIALVMPIVAACGDDDDDDDGGEATAPPAAATTAPGGQAATPTTAAPAAATPTTGEAAATPTTGEAAATPTTGAAETPATGTGTGRVEGGDLTFGQTMEEIGNEGGTLIEGSISDISTVMPVVTDDDASDDFQSTMFEELISTNPFTLEPVGLLAEAWESNEDASVWTIYLRDGVTWHDGEAFTADDVVFTYELHMNEGTGSSYTADLTSKIASVEAVDDLTVQFNLTGTLVDFLVDIGGYKIVAEHVWADVDPASVKTDGGATGQDPARVVGTGPFIFEEWVTGDHATSVRYDDYWNGAPALDEYIYKVVTDQAAGTAQLKTGEIDFFQGVSEAEVAGFEGTDVTVIPADRLSFTYYGTNLDPSKTTVFQDKEVRQALLYALDREALVEEIRFGFGITAVGTMPPLSWAYNPEGIELTYEYDPDKAMELLDSAGWTDTNGDGTRDKDGQELAFTMYTNAGNNVRESYLVAFQEYWAEIGVNMTPEFIPFPDLVDRITETFDFEAFLLGFGWDASPDQWAMWGCEAYGGGFNSVMYCNDEVDALLEEARVETDQARRIELYTEMQNILMDELPAAMLDFPQLPTGVNNRVHNVFPSDINTYWNLNMWWVEE
jgi:peptide/nickel transport system substrate-binding protein